MVRHTSAAERREKVAARLAARSRRTAEVGTTPTSDKDLFEQMTHGRAILAFPKTYEHQDTVAILAAARAAAAEWRRRYPGRLPAPAKRWAQTAHGVAHGLFAARSAAGSAAS